MYNLFSRIANYYLEYEIPEGDRERRIRVANIARYYADLLEQWENESYEQECGADWLEEVGEAVKFYAMECAAKGKTPTFKGLIEHIRKKR